MPPSTPTAALITPSFRGDFDRCRWLVESAQQWVPPSIKHYLVIDRRDVPMFRPLCDHRTEILVVEDLLPWWLMRLPGVPKFWMSFKTVPVRNWILQQIVKLSMPQHVPEEALFFVDSDTFFAAPFSLETQLRGELLPLFRETGQGWRDDHNNQWHRVASKLLGVPQLATYDTGFIGNVICWRKSTGLALLKHLETQHQRDWHRVIASQIKFSEYILYGHFCDTVLGHDKAGHWSQPLDQTLCYWDTKPLDLAGLSEFRLGLKPEHHSVMVSAKSGTRIADVREAFRGG